MNIRELIEKLCCFNFWFNCLHRINYRTYTNITNYRSQNLNLDNFDIDYILLEDLEKTKKDKCIQTEIIEEENSIEEERLKLDIHITDNDFSELNSIVYLNEKEEIGDFLMDREFQLEKSNFDFIN